MVRPFLLITVLVCSDITLHHLEYLQPVPVSIVRFCLPVEVIAPQWLVVTSTDSVYLDSRVAVDSIGLVRVPLWRT